jgi:C4-dicarboxylate-specific signal transduction histidine kinase
MNRGRSGLEFFSAIAASVTHELNNSLSIIDQSQGLLADLIAASEAGRAIEPQRVKTVQERIDRQVRNGVAIVGRFNRFAHSLDDPAGRFDLCGQTDNIVALSRRFAEMKKVRLACNLPDGEMAVSGDAFLLLQALFMCMQMLLEGSEEGDRLEVSVEQEESAHVISVAGTAKSAVKEDDERCEQLARLMQAFDGTYNIEQGALGGTALNLHVGTNVGGSR